MVSVTNIINGILPKVFHLSSLYVVIKELKRLSLRIIELNVEVELISQSNQ